MYSRSTLFKLDKLQIKTMNEAAILREYLESIICYIAKKTIIDSYYLTIDVRYNYNAAKIDNAFDIVEHLIIVPNLKNALFELKHVLTKNIEENIHEFYMSGYAKTGCLNINSMLINCNTLVITYEFFPKIKEDNEISFNDL